MRLRDLLVEFNLEMLEIVALVPKYGDKAEQQLENEIKKLKEFKLKIEEKIHGRNDNK